MKRNLTILAAGVMVLAAVVFSRSSAQPVREPAFIKYRLAEWSYEYSIRNLGTKSQGEGGVLSYAEKTLDATSFADLRVNDYVHTPWGTLYWWGRATEAWGGDGWLAHPKPYAAKGKRLTPPDAQPGHVLLSTADNATTVALSPGNYLGIHLPTLAPEESAWAVKNEADVLAPALPPVPRVQHLPGWGSLNRQVFHFRVVKTGKSTLVLRHGGEAGKEWKVTVEANGK